MTGLDSQAIASDTREYFRGVRAAASVIAATAYNDGISLDTESRRVLESAATIVCSLLPDSRLLTEEMTRGHQNSTANTLEQMRLWRPEFADGGKGFYQGTFRALMLLILFEHRRGVRSSTTELRIWHALIRDIAGLDPNSHVIETYGTGVDVFVAALAQPLADRYPLIAACGYEPHELIGRGAEMLPFKEAMDATGCMTLESFMQLPEMRLRVAYGGRNTDYLLTQMDILELQIV
ncbi:MAG: hypothetical protein WBP12_01610 [Candidatus Saccharimonas sp.]